jgi:hypothetical protein
MDEQPVSTDAEVAAPEPIATVKMLNLPEGTYRITVTDGARDGALCAEWVGPALQISPAPVLSEGTLELFPGPGTFDRWLQRREDSVLARIRGGSAGVLLTSLRQPDSAAMSIDICRVDNEDASPTIGAADWGDDEGMAAVVPLEVLAHIQRLGDVEFSGGSAGSPGRDLWVEGIAIRAPGLPTAEMLEYCAVRSDGVLTPWLNGESFCGSRGLGVALVGFALRIKPAFVHAYECAYGARFASGGSCEWLHDGALCQSNFAGDPIITLEVRIFELRAARKEAGDAVGTRSAEAG